MEAEAGGRDRTARRGWTARGLTGPFALVAALLFLVLPASAIDLPGDFPQTHPFRPGQPPRPAEVVDRTLERVLEGAAPGQKVEAVIQFVDSVQPRDRDLMRNLGIEVRQEYRVIPAVYAVGTREALSYLAGHPRTFWMEHNSQMQLLMNGTTTVINATTVWNSQVIYEGGGGRDPIDGTGVTVALVDTGVDGGHPDLDYGSKTIINLKSDFDLGYTEVQDSDTGSGHGTHCAGTILGNGDASGGARRGVAPGARLVAISTGEHFLQNVLGALQWVYEHSRPGNNPYNIKVCSNSWGAGAGEYNPMDSITLVNMKLVFENGVVVVFAAGNSGGDGSDIQTSNYGNAPFVLEVAAALHDGGGMASFSSRGQADLNQTWPDIAAPGYHIWATEARGTQITAMTKQNPEDRVDAYYMSISGTSMATPHVSGCVALMMQAAPSLRISYVMSESADNSTPTTFITEAEYILKLTADYMPSDGGGNGVPQNNSTGGPELDSRPHDFAQGYGLINASRAVQVCLILEEMRRTDTCATAFDAYQACKRSSGISAVKDVKYPTDRLVTSWKGDWGYLVDARNTLTTRHARSVFIPENASKLRIDLNYNPIIGSEKAAGQLTVAVDSNRDGSIEWRGQSGISNSGAKHDEVAPGAIGATGTVWDFYIEGTFFKLPGIGQGNPIFNQYREVLVEYTLGIEAIFESSSGTVRVPGVDLHAAYAQWDFGSYGGVGNVTIEMPRYFYDFGLIAPPDAQPGPQAPPSASAPLAALAVAAVGALAAYYWWSRKRKLAARPKQAN